VITEQNAHTASPLCFKNFFFPAILFKSPIIPKIISVIGGKHDHKI